MRAPCKPCCIVRYLIYILLYVLARFAIWINEWIKRINDIIYNKILTILIFKLLNINWHLIVTGSKLISQKQLFLSDLLEWFSFECRKVIGFAFATLHDWLKKFTPIFHPVRRKTKTNRDSLARVFPRLASAACNYDFWLVHCIVCVLCDWLEYRRLHLPVNARTKNMFSTDVKRLCFRCQTLKISRPNSGLRDLKRLYFRCQTLNFFRPNAKLSRQSQCSRGSLSS